jgi:hypothetical protein
MSTFLQLVQDAAEECDLATLPTSVVSQSGEFKKFVKWVKDANTEVDLRHSGMWRYLRHGFTLDTTDSDDTYAYTDCEDTTSSATIDRFGTWRLDDPDDPPKIYLTSSGVSAQRWLIWVPWESFKMIYKIGTMSTSTGVPAHITINPSNEILLGPTPNGIYTIDGDYYRSPQTLAADDDVPEMPAQYHQLLVYKAMVKYGYLNAAPECVQRGQVESKKLLRGLEGNQFPRLRRAGPIA